MSTSRNAAPLLEHPRVNRIALSDAIVRGLPLAELDRLKRELALTDDEVATCLGVSARTISRLRRRTPRARLDRVTSDRLYRVAAIFALATEVLDGAARAREWLRQPAVGLGMRVPFDLLVTEAGAREVETLLGRIEHSVGL